ncbi:alanine racemase [Gryllotalpicola sp.]|uniref:alanine racemase n=1 Tax=Gryllotalpicola sp. TaxID=1932787 RepID=UPI00261323B8|nr:alanine racemase [Gryllotalpicola sp.]
MDLSALPADRSWERPGFWPALTAATAELDPPYAALHLGALAANAHDMLRRAGGKPIRVASKSVRVRSVLDAVLALPGYAGVLAYTLDEALWLAESAPDVVVGYPSADRAAIRRLGASAELAARVTVMVDSVAHLDFIDAVAPAGDRAEIRVAIELDASWEGPTGRIGVWRSPVRTAVAARTLAVHVARRPGFRLVGLMSYEAQIAGQGDAPEGRAAFGATVRWMQRRSQAELRERRAEAVAAVRQVAELEFVNGGGTGSLEFTSGDDSVTEIAAGSGLLGGHLFDNYRLFRPAPAAAFALSVVRRPRPDIATVLGGGWIASGPPGEDRLPRAVWPEGLGYAPREAAGEVQTPLIGPAASALQVGDRVWFRHTKSGELSEHVTAFALVDDVDGRPRITGEAPTYRGEGKAFL